MPATHTESIAPETLGDVRILTTAEWQERATEYRRRAERWTLPYKRRRSRQEKHPVHDFLFQYYMYSPGKLERWHPAPGEALTDSPEARGRFHGPAYHAAGGLVTRDASRMDEAEIDRLQTAAAVLTATEHRPANFGCYGMHEWAMVYRGHDVRHEGIAPLRLPQAEIDRFIEERPVACTHFEAFRFFAEDAKPLNRIELEWSTRHDLEQPGCIHANMDLYRWAYESMPWVGSEIVMDCFELASELRVLDMQASPYDLSEMGFEPVRIETDEGRAEYQRRQRELSERASALRRRLVCVVSPYRELVSTRSIGLR